MIEPPRRLKIGVLSLNPKLYSTQRLAEAGRERGHDVKIINYLRCYMDITARRPMVIYQGNPLRDFDAVIPRIGASRSFYGTAVVRQFEMMNVFTAADSQAISRSRDKLRSLQILATAGVDMPVTSFAHHTKDSSDLIEIVGGAPLVIKLLEGTQGLGVVLAETKKAAQSVIEAFRGLDANILVQEFIKESRGEDIRAFVVGRRVRGRHAAPGAAGGIPFESASRRRRGAHQAHASGAQDGDQGGLDAGPEDRRRRYGALRPWTARPGGQLLAGARRHRDRFERGRRRRDHQVRREERPACQTSPGHEVLTC